MNDAYQKTRAESGAQWPSDEISGTGRAGRGLALNLRLTRQDFALKVHLALPATGVTVLFGPSGSGKTTVLRCVAGLEKADGHVLIGDEVWQDSERQVWVPTWARALGYVFQEASLFEHLTVQANLRYGIDRVKTASAQRALDSAIELLGIDHLLGRKPQSLSGGERQRVAIARALATEPRILLLDEPLASLDMARRHEILPWLERMHRELQIPMLYVTHAMQELTRLADHVVLMHAGGVLAQGPVSDVLCDPRVAGIAGGQAGVVLSGIVSEHDTTYHLTRIDLHGTSLWVGHKDLATGTSVRLHIQANDVSLTTEQPKGTSVQNILQGEVEAIDNDINPGSCLVTVRHREHRLIARITRRALAQLDLEPQETVWCLIKSVALSEC